MWTADVTPTPTIGIDIQPIVVDGVVLVSSVPVSIGGIYAPGDHGVVYALDAATGAVRWTFDTVQGDLWGHPEVNSGGGAWYPPAVDQGRGLVYVGVANPAPFPGTPEWPNGTSRPGDEPLHRLARRPRPRRPARCVGSTRSRRTTSSTATRCTR